MIKNKASFWYKLRVFRWAAMHRDDFKQCYINLPIRLRFGVCSYDLAYNISVVLSVQRNVTFFIPYDIQFAYLMEQNPDAFDDIPF